jgi:hypothetical protein
LATASWVPPRWSSHAARRIPPRPEMTRRSRVAAAVTPFRLRSREVRVGIRGAASNPVERTPPWHRHRDRDSAGFRSCARPRPSHANECRSTSLE